MLYRITLHICVCVNTLRQQVHDIVIKYLLIKVKNLEFDTSQPT